MTSAVFVHRISEKVGICDATDVDSTDPTLVVYLRLFFWRRSF